MLPDVQYSVLVLQQADTTFSIAETKKREKIK